MNIPIPFLYLYKIIDYTVWLYCTQTQIPDIIGEILLSSFCFLILVLK
jgi:hypothetical protein